jgi:hypothetical protein
MKSIVILGTPGFVRDPKRFDDETLLQVLGANSGNLMFQFAATRIIDAPQVHVSRAEVPHANVSVFREAKALVFPAANHLRLGADWTGLASYLENAKVPLIVLGLGAQSPVIGGELATVAAITSDRQVQRLASVFRERAVFVSVRGEFSRTVCEQLGIHDTHVIGCPSALINPDPGLGRSIDARIAALRDNESGWHFAATAAAPFEIVEDPAKLALERTLFRWLVEANGLYVQQSGGVSAMNATNGCWYKLPEDQRQAIAGAIAPEMDFVDFWLFMARAGRFYLGVPEWQEGIASLDFVIGTRLHGNMAAIAAGMPGIIVAHDSRTGELADTMCLPGVSMDDVLSARSIRDVVDRVTFDGMRFDVWRSRAARAMTDAFDKIEVPVAAHVRALAAGE